MVAAGVYLVARMFPFFAGEAYWSGVAFDSPALWVVAGVGGFTALFAATIALVQHDIKKVLAYSTVSQLGYMMLGIGTGSFAAGMFHLWTHAFFKALLFLGSGSVIHAVGSNDMRVMGGLARRMPVTFFTFLVGTLAIAGVPWLFSGFYSKESILIQAFAFGRYWGAHGAPLAPMAMLPFVLAALAAGLTAFYMFRVVFLTFAGRPRDTHRHAHAHESAWTMTVPLAVLAAFSVAAAGFLGGHHWFAHRVNDVVTVEQYLAVAGEADGPGHWVLPEASFVEVVHAGHRVREPVPSSWATPEGTREARDFAERRLGAEGPVTWLSIAVALGGIALSWLVFAGPLAGRDLIGQAGALAACRRLLENLYYVDWFYYRVVIGAVHVLRLFLGGFDRYVVDGLVNLWGWTLRVVARLSGWADHAGVDGAVRGTSGAVLLLGGSARRLQTGRLQDYLYLTVFLGVMVFGVILMSRHLFSGNLL
ncbi:MAG: hypothetical protein HY722_09540, partial [Planctomycetes bacterium]|nr:hypothetical protein [Planctomycetota bacterium]